MRDTQVDGQWWTNLFAAARASGISQFVLEQFTSEHPIAAGVIFDDTDTTGPEDAGQ